MIHAVILCAGQMNYNAVPIVSSHTNSFIPINGKPVMGWILEDMVNRKVNKVTVVMSRNQSKIRNYLKNIYSEIININYVTTTGQTILTSLYDGIKQIQANESVLVVLGDTLIKDEVRDYDTSFAFIGRVEKTRRWCTVDVNENGVITEYYEKNDFTPPKVKKALSGYYLLRNTEDFKKSVNEAIRSKKTQISDALRIYGENNSIQAREVYQWYDFGNIDNLLDAKRKLIPSRYFNTISINATTNTITKSSFNTSKLIDESEWYKKIPDELKPLTPRVFNVTKNKNMLSLTQEYYGYPTLAELFLYSDLDKEAWVVIINRILEVHNEFCKHKGDCSTENLYDMYYTKTITRIKEAKNKPILKQLLRYPRVTINGRNYFGYPIIEKGLRERINDLCSDKLISVIHGDLCFSNILFDYNNQIVKLIDPRGSFGIKGIFGDARYDIAKLRHSIGGLYDYIVAGMYNLKYSGNDLQYKIFSNGIQRFASTVFDESIQRRGYKLEEISLIEGLLFLSMIPLHDEDTERQVMFFIQGLKLLNEGLQ